LIHKYINKV